MDVYWGFNDTGQQDKKEPHPEAEVPSHGGHQHVDVIADDACEAVSGQAKVGFEMADDGF